MRASLPAAAGVGLLVTMDAAAAVPPPQPARDGRVADAARPSVIRGRVTRSDTGGPLAMATVRVAPSGDNESTAVTTDLDGRYELSLRPGRYTVRASKAGYVPLDYGQRRAFEPGTVVEARAGSTLRNVNMSLPRGAVLAGALLDPTGEPAVGVQVRPLRYEFRGGRWRLRNVGLMSDTTDDLGQFRVYGLPPGNYFLQAQPPSYWRRGERIVRYFAPPSIPAQSTSTRRKRSRSISRSS